MAIWYCNRLFELFRCQRLVRLQSLAWRELQLGDFSTVDESSSLLDRNKLMEYAFISLYLLRKYINTSTRPIFIWCKFQIHNFNSYHYCEQTNNFIKLYLYCLHNFILKILSNVFMHCTVWTPSSKLSYRGGNLISVWYEAVFRPYRPRMLR